MFVGRQYINIRHINVIVRYKSEFGLEKYFTILQPDLMYNMFVNLDVVVINCQ
jgi:hypothetical protein